MMNDETMSTQQKTDAILILYPRIEREWVHFDWVVYVNGKRRALYKSWSSRCATDAGPLFPSFRHSRAVEWLISEDKKGFRAKELRTMGGLWDQDITLEMIKKNAPYTNWYDRAQYTPSFDRWNITEFAVLPVRICPRTGIVWRYRTEEFPVSMQYPARRVFVLSILRRSGRDVVMRYPYSMGEACKPCPGPVFVSGDRLRRIWFQRGFPLRDPRAFLYEKKERIRKSQIVTFISRRIRKISKIRPVSKSEKFFFQSLIGIKRLMDLVAA
jgi:hypothetical protein